MYSRKACQDSDNLSWSECLCPIIKDIILNSPQARTWCTNWKWKTLGVRISTVVTLTWFVLSDIENRLSRCVKLATWHVTKRTKGTGGSYVLVEKPAETQTSQGLLQQCLVNETSKHLLDFVGETNANKTESQKGGYSWSCWLGKGTCVQCVIQYM
jgi:hypothetical protein